MMRPDSLARFLGWRWRGYWGQELLAAAGIAAGVAIVFAVLVSNGSITAGARDILTGIGGTAQLQLTARSSDGVDERIVARVRAVEGVELATPLLEQRVVVAYGNRRVAVELVGVDSTLGRIGGILSQPLLAGLLSVPQLFVPRATGEALGLPDDGRGTRVIVETRGLRQSVVISDVLDEPVVGALADGNLAGAPLADAQRWAGLPGRVTRIVVRTAPGAEAAVRERLERVAGDGLDVGTIDDELALLRQASAPNDQATELFAVVGVLVGMLLASTAVLLTLPERRGAVRELALQGTPRSKIAQTVLFPALVLGLLAGGLGIAGGLVLLRTAAHEPPGYLQFAWAMGSGQQVTTTVVAIALGAGVLLSVLSAALPLLDLRRDPFERMREEAEEPGQGVSPRLRALALGAGVGVIALSTLLAVLTPALTVIAVGALAVGALLVLPALFSGVLAVVRRWPRRDRRSISLEAERELRVTTVRSLALAATAAIAIFAVVAPGGASRNLLHGLYETYREYTASGDVWITGHGDDLALQPLQLDPEQLAAVPGVAAARAYQGGLADVGDRRIWIQARDPADAPLLPPSQLLDGDARQASEQIRGGGAITISRQLAEEHDIAVGDRFALDTPSGRRDWTVAAITTNLGWGPGTVVMNRDDYAAAWQTSAPTAVELLLRPGAETAAVIDAVRARLGPDVAPALRVQSAAQRNEDANAVARAGLARLGQIGAILLAAAAIALAAALSTTIWQRRTIWAERRWQAFPHSTALRLVAIEATLVLGTGCLVGALAGTYGHWMLGRWLELTTGYPAPYSISIPSTALACVVLIVSALALAALPADRAIRAPVRIALEPDT